MVPLEVVVLPRREPLESRTRMLGGVGTGVNAPGYPIRH